MLKIRSLFGLWCALLTVPMAAEAARPEVTDWPSWRGPNRDAVSTETGLLKSWSKTGPPLAWRVGGLGKGFASVAIADGRLFTMGERNGKCDLIALDLKDGKELWATPVGKGSPNCTPTVDGERIYALDRNGDLLCAKTDTGEPLWRKNFKQDFGGRMESGWGYSESPLVDGDRLLCTPGAKDALIVALDKQTGSTIWKAAAPANPGGKGQDGAGYSSIVISHAAGVKQYVQLTGRGVVAVAADDGRFLWSYNKIANGTANIPTPIVKDDYVFCSTGYGDGGAALLEIVRDGDGLKANEKYYYSAKELQNHHGGMVLVGDHIYFGKGHNNGFPVCVELKTGKITWGGGKNQIRGAAGKGSGSAAVVYADGHLYYRYQNAVMALVEANPRQYKLKGTFELAAHNGESWPHPVIHDGKLYLRDQGDLLCYNIRQK